MEKHSKKRGNNYFSYTCPINRNGINAKIGILFIGGGSPIVKIREILKGRGAITKIRGANIKGKYIREIHIRVDNRLQFIRFLNKLKSIKEIHILSVRDAKKEGKRSFKKS